MIQTFINIAVGEEFLHTVVDLIVLDVGPVGHVELLVNGKAPLISVVTNAAVISLSTHVVTIQSMTFRLSIQKFLCSDSLSISLSSNDTFAETTRRIRHGAPAENVNRAFCRRIIFLVNDLAFLVRVCCCTVVWVICFLAIEQYSVGFSALGHLTVDWEGQATQAELSILSVFIECGFVCALLVPSELSALTLRVHFHASFFRGSSITVLPCFVPAIVCDFTLIILLTFFAIFTIGLADRL